MAFNHRKLIPDPHESSEDRCESYCDQSKNVNRSCPDGCLSFCQLTCNSFITPDQHPNKPQKLPLTLTVSLSILCTFFFLFVVYTMYKFWNSSRMRRRPRPQEQEEAHDEFLDEDHGPVVDHPIWYIRTVGLQPSVISAITVCKYKRGDGLVEGTECSVCLNDFQEDETLRILPKCNHAFHLPCIDTWLRSHTNCPMCRAGIVSTSAVPAHLVSHDHGVDNSGRVEETQVGISENSGEFERGIEDDEAFELRIGIEEEGDLRAENCARIEENCNGDVGKRDDLEVDEVQPMRRSVSVDSLTASMISHAIANANLDSQLFKVNESNMGIVPKRSQVNQSLIKSVGSSSIGRSLQRGPASMKRSFSYSGKVFLSRYSRN